jgi:hypothetical protein
MIASRLLFAAALILVFLACWIFLPAPNRPLLALGVGAPEVSAWLVAGALIVLGLTFGIEGPAKAGPYVRNLTLVWACLLYTKPSPRDNAASRIASSS